VLIFVQVTIDIVGDVFQLFWLFQHIVHLIWFLQVVQKHTLGEVGNWTVVWWQVVSGILAPKIINIW